MSGFVPGLTLSRRLYAEQVAPLLGARFADLPHAAALIGRGSDVLGFDDEVSTDHDGGPRLQVFLRDDDYAAVGAEVAATLGPSVEVLGLHAYFRDSLALDVTVEPTAADWLTLPEHALAGIVSGAVHHDGIGLTAVRERLSYYPRDVWLYLLVTGWWRVHPEANLVGRTGSVGDDPGSRLLAARLVEDLVRLCFLMERCYAPYAKWLGSAFARLPCGPALLPVFRAVLDAGSWPEREEALLAAYAGVMARHDELAITPPVPVEEVRMWDRPFRVLWGDFPGLLHAEIRDPAVLAIAERWPIGPIDQVRGQLWPRGQRAALARLLEDRSGG